MCPQLQHRGLRGLLQDLASPKRLPAKTLFTRGVHVELVVSAGIEPASSSRRGALPIELRYRVVSGCRGRQPLRRVYRGAAEVRSLPPSRLAPRHLPRQREAKMAHGAVPARTARGTPGVICQPQHRRSLSYGRAYGLKGGSYAEQMRGRCRPPHDDCSAHVNNLFEIFCGFFRGVPQGHLFHCVGDAAPYNGLSVVGCRGWRTPRVLVSLRPRQPEIGKFSLRVTTGSFRKRSQSGIENGG